MIPLSPLFLLGDFSEGPWGDIVALWAEVTEGRDLCLTGDVDRASGYLVVARYPEDVAEAVALAHDRGYPPRPVIWVNDWDGSITRWEE